MFDPESITHLLIMGFRWLMNTHRRAGERAGRERKAISGHLRKNIIRKVVPRKLAAANEENKINFNKILSPQDDAKAQSRAYKVRETEARKKHNKELDVAGINDFE